MKLKRLIKDEPWYYINLFLRSKMENFDFLSPTSLTPEQIIYVEILQSQIELVVKKLHEIINISKKALEEEADKNQTEKEGNKILEIKKILSKIIEQTQWFEPEIINNLKIIHKCESCEEIRQVCNIMLPALENNIAKNHIFTVTIQTDSLHPIRVAHICSKAQELLPAKLIVLNNPFSSLSLIPNLSLSRDIQPVNDLEDKFSALSNLVRKSNMITFTYLKGHFLGVEEIEITISNIYDSPIIYEKSADGNLKEIRPKLAKELAQKISFINLKQEWESIRLLLDDFYELFQEIDLYLQQEKDFKSPRESVLLFLAKLASFPQDQILIKEGQQVLTELADILIEESLDKRKIALRKPELEKIIESKSQELGINIYLTKQIAKKINQFLDKNLSKIEYKPKDSSDNNLWMIADIDKKDDKISFAYLSCKDDLLSKKKQQIIITNNQAFKEISDKRLENLSCLVIHKILKNLETKNLAQHLAQHLDKSIT
jgi:hypothetical protein